MEKTSVDAIEMADIGGSERRSLSDALRASAVSVHEYRIAPHAGLPAGLHAHMDQEELFVVLAGTLTFETMSGEVSVPESAAIRFAPGDFQSGTNETDEEVVVLAIGAPPGTEDIRIPVHCPDCGHETLALDTDGPELTFICPDCQTTHVPADCPHCGGSDLTVTLDDESQTIVVCQSCHAEFDTPPIQE
jgi:uncharacterized cupin superfamily protein